MGKFNFQYIALVIAVILGGIVGSSIMSGIKDSQIKKLQIQHETELNKAIKDAEKRITDRKDSIAVEDKKRAERDLLVQKLYVDLLQDSLNTQKKRQDVKQLTPSEKTKWFLDRYSNTTE